MKKIPPRDFQMWVFNEMLAGMSELEHVRSCNGIPLSCKYDDLDWRGSLDRIVYSAEFACRLSNSTRGVDMFDANNHWTLLPLCLSVSAASLWLLYVLALTCLFVCCAGTGTSGSNSWIWELWICFDNDVWCQCVCRQTWHIEHQWKCNLGLYFRSREGSFSHEHVEVWGRHQRLGSIDVIEIISLIPTVPSARISELWLLVFWRLRVGFHSKRFPVFRWICCP